ncbi:MAG TPA: ABC transporter substrate-binding protein [Chloroflexota bacterium]|nr:ABC transporter substrate-binding protein [Chloroflexota bacterium]
MALNRRSFLRLAGVGLAGGVLAACGSSASQPAGSVAAGGAQPKTSGGRSTLDDLVNGARQEGQLNLSWGESSGGGGRSVRQWAEGLNRQYGLKLNIQFTPGPSMSDMGGKIIQELQAGQPAASDIYFGSSRAVTTLVGQNALELVDWASWAPHIKDPAIISVNGAAVPITGDVPGISYNSSKVAPADVPKGLQDLLNPKYKGRMAGHVDASTYAELASDELWGEQKTVDYVKQFAASVAGLLRSGEIERVLNGEFDLFSVDGAGSDVYRRKEAGEPLGHVIPADMPMREFRYMGVPRNSAHPHAAKLMLDFIMSREGQDVLFTYTYADHPAVPGSKFGAYVEKQAPGTKFHDLTIEFDQHVGLEKLNKFNAMFVAMMREAKRA